MMTMVANIFNGCAIQNPSQICPFSILVAILSPSITLISDSGIFAEQFDMINALGQICFITRSFVLEMKSVGLLKILLYEQKFTIFKFC
jgi:hypothetical protein